VRVAAEQERDVTRSAMPAQRRVWLAKVLMSLGVLYAVVSTVYMPWMLVNSVIFTALLVGGLVIGHWGERPEPGFKKRASLMALAVPGAIIAVWAIVQSHI
jgi:hypothetical protein